MPPRSSSVGRCSSPAATLPSQIIKQIIWNLVPVWLIPSPDEFNQAFANHKNDVVAFKAAIYTCFSWRTAALLTPAMWGFVLDIDNSSYRWIRKVLARSKPHPIAVLSQPREVSGWDQKEPWRNLLAAFGRVQSFAILMKKFEPDSPFGQALSQPAPNMEFFLLSVHLRRIQTDPAPLVAFPPSWFFNSEMPKLSHLSLRRCAFLMSLPIQNRLTHLSITDEDGALTTNTGLTALSWLRLIQHLDLLEILIIQNCIDPGEAKDEHLLFAFPVKLPRMVKVVLTGQAGCLAGILCNLEVPSSCQFNLQAFQSDEFDSSQALGEVITDLLLVADERYDVDLPLVLYMEFVAVSKTFRLNVPDKLLFTSLGPRTNGNPPSQFLFSYLCSFEKRKLVRRLHTLNLGFHVHADLEACSDLLGRLLASCTDIEALVLYPDCLFSLLPLLTAPQSPFAQTMGDEDMSSPRHPRFILPKLKSMTIIDPVMSCHMSELEAYRQWRKGKFTDLNIQIGI